MSLHEIGQDEFILSEVDMVVDTNVWMHASNPEVDTFKAALDFVVVLLRSSTVLCFDIGASLNEAGNRSRILSEYRAQVKGTGVGTKILEALLQSERWVNVSDKVTDAERKVINQYVHDVSDRVFARVATNSESHSLISHDTRAFHKECKTQLRKKCGVQVSSCSEVLAW